MVIAFNTRAELYLKYISFDIDTASCVIIVLRPTTLSYKFIRKIVQTSVTAPAINPTFMKVLLLSFCF